MRFWLRISYPEVCQGSNEGPKGPFGEVKCPGGAKIRARRAKYLMKRDYLRIPPGPREMWVYFIDP